MESKKKSLFRFLAKMEEAEEEEDGVRVWKTFNLPARNAIVTLTSKEFGQKKIKCTNICFGK